MSLAAYLSYYSRIWQKMEFKLEFADQDITEYIEVFYNRL